MFDVGAHVGNRVASFRRLGARVIAIEPQRAMVRTLRLLYGRDRSVTIEAVAVGGQPGRARMLINPDNPTVSSVSSAFVTAAEGAPGWEGQRWSEFAEVEVTTLDALIARHGVPAFIKIDVEGFELPVVQGAVETLQRCRPLILVEQAGNEEKHFGRPRDEASAFLEDLGMELHPDAPVMKNDRLYRFKEVR